MSWDGLQCAVLDALGHARYRMHAATADALPDDPLLDALLRAAGRDREGGDAVLVARQVGTLPPLRRSPQAKRALWPLLRRLRATAVVARQ
ncbi:hypothetical protein LDO26_03760 [Luteimonas sp. BDR2-5]|uniref:hypothetical protein n=1 Tax=Proluteimonas luteida TaxID=2878685 RepID=UPI001E551D0E|nr:hypothetical protein [Luteimonas sp. BDR2-5]MCD9027330.1 hypothetical protein [Luteimonas sp. BDR2-5]